MIYLPQNDEPQVYTSAGDGSAAFVKQGTSKQNAQNVADILSGKSKNGLAANNGKTGDKKNKNASGTGDGSSTYKAPEDEAVAHAKEMSDRTYGDADNGGTMLDKTLEWLGVKDKNGIQMSREAADVSDKLKAEKNKLAMMEAQQKDAGGSGDSFEAIGRQQSDIEAQRKVVEELEKSFDNLKRTDQSDYYSSLFGKDDFKKVSEKGSQTVTNNRVRAAEENPYDPTAINPLSVTNDKNLVYINDDERAVYNYLLGNGDTKGADEFLEYIMPTLNARAGQETATNIENSGNGFMRTLREADLGGAAGVQNAVSGIAQNFTSDVKPTNELQFALQGVNENIAKRHEGNEKYNLEALAVNAAQTIGNMAPSLAVGGGIGTAMMGLSSRGNTYKRLREEGYTEEQAKQVGTILGIAEATTQYALGGVSRLGGKITQGAVDKVTKNITSGIARSIVELGLEDLGEIAEELLQNKIEAATRNYFLDEKNDIATFTDDDAYTVALTAITTTLLQLPAVAINNASSSSVGKSVKLNDATESLIQRGMQSANPEVRELAEGMQSGKTAQSDINLGNLAKGLNAEGVDLDNIAAQTAAQQIAPETVSPEARTEVLNIMQSGRVNNTDAKTILADPALRAAFTAISGNPLNGTSYDNQKAIQDYARSSAYATQQSQQAAQQFADMQTAQNEAEAQAAAQANAEAEQARIDADAEAQAREAAKQQDNIDFVANIAKGGATVAEAHAIVDSPALRALWEMMTGTTLPESRNKATDAVRAGAEIVNNVTGADLLANMATQQTAPEAAQPTAPQTGADILAEIAGVPQNAPESVSNASTAPTNENAQAMPQNNAQTVPVELNNQANTNNTAQNANADIATDENGFTGERVKTQDAVFDSRLSEEERQIPGLTEEEAKHVRHADAEVDSRAKARIDTDRAEARKQVMEAKSWSDVDTATAGMLIESELNEASEAATRGDVESASKLYKELAELKAQWNKQGTKEGQALRQRSRFVTQDVQSTAANILFGEHKANEKQLRGITQKQKCEVMNVVNSYAKRFNDIQKNKPNDTDAIIGLIKEVSKTRRTDGMFIKNAKDLDFALNEVAKLPDGASFLREVLGAQIKNIASDYISPGAINMLNAWRFMSTLSNPRTSGTNVGSNFLLGSVVEVLSNNLAVAPDILLSGLTGQREVAFDKGVFDSNYWKGASEGLLKSFIQVNLDADISDSASGYLEKTGRTFKMVGNPVERMLSSLERNLAYQLTTTDEMAKGATRKSQTANLNKLADKGKTNFDAVEALAENNAKYRTLQQDSKIAEETVKIRGSIDRLFGIGNERTGRYGLGTDIMMYAKIPANSVLTVLDYNPSTSVMFSIGKIGKFAWDKAHGTVKVGQQADVAKALGRVGTGMGFVAAFGAMAAKGIIRDGDDDDKDVNAQRKAERMSGTQVNWSALERWMKGEDPTPRENDNWMGMGWMPVLNSLMTLGADVAEAYQNDGTLDKNEVLSATWDSLSSAFMDFPAVSKISSLINTWKYSEAENGWGKAAETAVNGLGQTASSILVPNVERAVVTGLDPYERDASADTVGQSILNNIMSGTVFQRGKLPIKIDNYGNPITNVGGTQNFMNKVFLPGALTTGNTSANSKFIDGFYQRTGDASIVPDRKAPEKVTIKDPDSGEEIKFELSTEEKRQYQQTRGNLIDNYLEQLRTSEGFNNLSEAQQLKTIKDVENWANRQTFLAFADGKGFNVEQSADTKLKGISDIPLYFTTANAFATIDSKNPDYAQADGIIENFDSLPPDIQTALSSSYSDIPTLRYASTKGVGTKRFYEIKEQTTALAKDFNGSTSGVVEAIAIANGIKGSDAEKIIALEVVNLPDKETGKRAAVVRRYEAANSEGISFDMWSNLESAVFDATKARGGSQASKQDIYDAVKQVNSDYGTNYAGWYVRQVWNKYSADEDRIETEDDYFSRDYVPKEWGSLYDVKKNGADALVEAAYGSNYTGNNPNAITVKVGKNK